MWTYAMQDDDIRAEGETKAVSFGDPYFPHVFVSTQFLESQRRMCTVLHEEAYLFPGRVIEMEWKFLEVTFERIGEDEPWRDHIIRSTPSLPLRRY